MSDKLNLSFYMRKDVVKIAKDLLGKVLKTKIDGVITSGRIVETEAYSFIERGSHAFKGKTNRNAIMFETGGVSYIYLCYGIHQMFNVVTNKRDIAEAVLIRALEPMEGKDTMMKRMNVKSMKRITSGPGKLTKALAITRKWNGEDLSGNFIWIENDKQKIRKRDILSSPRIGIDYAGLDALLPWRFTMKGNEWITNHVKKKRTSE